MLSDQHGDHARSGACGRRLHLRKERHRRLALARTGAVLPHGSLIPNHAAKAMISDFLDEARRHQAALDASMADEVKGAP